MLGFKLCKQNYAKQNCFKAISQIYAFDVIAPIISNCVKCNRSIPGFDPASTNKCRQRPKHCQETKKKEYRSKVNAIVRNKKTY